jgi:hypothetical protein
LLADAEERLRLAEELPNRIESIRGWAVNEDGSVRVTATVHGALADLALTERALALGPEALGAEIVRIAGAANRAALAEGVGALSHSLGDADTARIAESVGLGNRIEPDAPVLPYVPGVDPNADKWQVIDPTRPAPIDDEDDALSIDFSRFRSDR